MNRILANCTRMQRHSRISSCFFILEFFLPAFSCPDHFCPIKLHTNKHEISPRPAFHPKNTRRKLEDRRGYASTLPLLSRLLPLLPFRPLPNKYIIKYTKSALHHLHTKERSLHPRQLKHSPRLQPLHKTPLPVHKNRTRSHAALESSLLYPDPEVL